MMQQRIGVDALRAEVIDLARNLRDTLGVRPYTRERLSELQRAVLLYTDYEVARHGPAMLQWLEDTLRHLPVAGRA